MRRRCGMADQGFGISNVDKPFDEPECIVKSPGLLIASPKLESHERTRHSTEILLCKRMMRVVGKACIIDVFDTGQRTQMLRHPSSVRDMSLDADRDCFNPLQQEKCIEGGEH